MDQLSLKTLLVLPYTISVLGNLSFILRFFCSPTYLKRLSNLYIFLLSIIHTISGLCQILVYLPLDTDGSKSPIFLYISDSVCASLSATLVLFIIGERYYHNASLTTSESSESKRPILLIKLVSTIYVVLLLSFITGVIATTIIKCTGEDWVMHWHTCLDILMKDLEWERSNPWLNLELNVAYITGFLLPVLPTIYYYYRTRKLLQLRKASESEAENGAIPLPNFDQNDEIDGDLSSTQRSMDITGLGLTIVHIHFFCWIPLRLVNTSFVYDFYASGKGSNLKLAAGYVVYFWKDLNLILNPFFYAKHRNTIFSP